MLPAFALGIGLLVRVTEDGGGKIWSGAAMIGMSMAQDDSFYLAEGGCGLTDGSGHRSDPSIEDGDAVRALDQVDAHVEAKPSADDPDIVGYPIRFDPHEPGSLRE
jgi:hypothetical protein